jgi:hypothetical protein
VELPLCSGALKGLVGRQLMTSWAGDMPFANLLRCSLHRASSCRKNSTDAAVNRRGGALGAGAAVCRQLPVAPGTAHPTQHAHAPTSQPPPTRTARPQQRTWIALNEKGVKYNRVFVDLKEKPEWFFPLNPYGRVPTLAWKDGRGTHSLYEVRPSCAHTHTQSCRWRPAA